MRAAVLQGVVVFVAGSVASGCGPATQEETPAPDARIRHTPFAASFVGSSHSRIEQTFSGQSDVTEVGMRYYLAVGLASTDSGLQVTLTIDSVTDVRDQRGTGGATSADSARGIAFTGALSSTGEITGLTTSGMGGSLADELSSRLLARFFPVIPAGGIEVGTVWSDTIETAATLGGVDNTVHNVRQHEVTEWTEFAGYPALLIVTTSGYTFSGAGVQVGQAFTLEGEGRRHWRQYVGADGRFLGFVSADTAEAEAHLIDAGIVIPVFQTRADTLTISN